MQNTVEVKCQLKFSNISNNKLVFEYLGYVKITLPTLTFLKYMHL